MISTVPLVATVEGILDDEIPPHLDVNTHLLAESIVEALAEDLKFELPTCSQCGKRGAVFGNVCAECKWEAPTVLKI